MTGDKYLIWRTRHGSRNAANELFERHYKEIYAYIYRQCGNKELAMDLTQDSFVAAFRGLPSYDDEKAEFRTWLYRIAANKIADYYRSKRYHQYLAESPLDETASELPEDNDILERLAERELIGSIMDIVSGYDLVWVHIFQMKIFEDLSFAQIGAVLGLPENTVKTRYYAIIKRIRKELSVWS